MRPATCFHDVLFHFRLRVFGASVCAALCASLASAGSWAAARVHVPPECGSQTEFEHEVQQRIFPDAIAPTTTLHIEPHSQGYRLRMRVGSESRELQGKDCRELFRAAVVITVAQSSKSRNTPTGEAPAESNTGTSSAAPSDWHAGVRLAGGIQIGMTPRPVPALELEGNLRSLRFGVALAARTFGTGTVRDDSGRGVAVHGWGGQVTALYQPSPLWEARLGASAFRLTGIGLGSFAETQDVAWAGGAAAGLAFFPVRTPAWVGVGGEAQLNLVQAAFEILNYKEVFEVPLFGVSLFLRVGYDFF